MDKESKDLTRKLEKTPRKPKINPEIGDGFPVKKEEVVMKETFNPGNSEILMQHPVYNEISLANGRINRMSYDQMKKHCKELNLECNGKREAVKRRLKEHYKNAKLIEAGLVKPRENRNVDYFVVIDFEATCEEKNPPDYKHEIIEFPAVLVSSTNPARIVDIFHSYCRPVINTELSNFCKGLTGITQSTVDSSDTFPLVHSRFLEWMEKHALGSKYSYSIVTDGPFDMGRFLYMQVQHINAEFPEYGKVWVNLRKSFSNFYKGDFYAMSTKPAPGTMKLPGLQTMLDMLGLDFEGQPHSGLDDSKNIARVLIRLVQDKAFVRINEKLIVKDLNHNLTNEDKIKYGANSPKLRSVTSVPRKESEEWFKEQKEMVKRKRKSLGLEEEEIEEES